MTASLELFLSPAGAPGQALRRGLPVAAVRDAAPDGTDTKPTTAPDFTGDLKSLRDQGWGVIVPRGPDGDRLLALAKPLLDQRAADQDAEVPIYRVPPDMTAAEAAAWLDRKLVANALQTQIPGYLLILGRPDQVSFELQQVVGTLFYTGRLGFDAEASYEAYIAKLLAAERAPKAATRAAYFNVRDGTPAMEVGRRLLIQPCAADADAQRATGRFPAEIAAVEAEVPTGAADRLFAAAATADVMLTCSHGLGAPTAGWKSADDRRALQGALSMGGGLHVEPQSLAQARFVANGVWVMFACFGAGTPRHSAYYPWLARLREAGEADEDLGSLLVSLPREGEPAFVGALPQAALASPGGPLAIVGHLDLAWSYGFQDLEKASRGERHRRFHELLAELVRGAPVGLALGSTLVRARSQIQNELTIATADQARSSSPAGPAAASADSLDERARLGHRWMALQDLDGYIALGDPAARLAVPAEARKPKPAAAPPSISTAAAPARPTLDAAAIEAAVHDLIAGRATRDQLASRCAVTAATVDEWRRVYTEAGRRAVSELGGLLDRDSSGR